MRDENYGEVSRRLGNDSSRTYTSRPIQSIQGAVPARTSRSLSASRSTVTAVAGQTQFTEPYITAQNWGESSVGQNNVSPIYTQQPQQYTVTQSLPQDPTYRPPVGYLPPDGQPPDRSAYERSYHPHPQQTPPYTHPIQPSQHHGSHNWDRQPDYQSSQQQASPQQRLYPSSQHPPSQQYSLSRSIVVHGAPHADVPSLGEDVPGEYRGRPGELHLRRKRSRPDPTCRFPNCFESARWDLNTNELTEYCGQEHMREDVQRGVPLCPSCKKSPRRLDSDFCGSSCAAWEERKYRQQPAGSGYYHRDG